MKPSSDSLTNKRLKLFCSISCLCVKYSIIYLSIAGHASLAIEVVSEAFAVLVLIPSGILIHETVWPQYTRVTDDRRQTDDKRHLMTIAERCIATVG